jgi:hypothetical protein
MGIFPIANSLGFQNAIRGCTRAEGIERITPICRGMKRNYCSIGRQIKSRKPWPADDGTVRAVSGRRSPPQGMPIMLLTLQGGIQQRCAVDGTLCRGL